MTARRLARVLRAARTAIAALALLAALAPALGAQDPAGGDPWARLPEILARIVAPEFPARDFVVTKFGAKGDGKTDASSAIRKAIEACAKAGGGRVVVPEGTFLTGPIRLKSRVDLHLAKGNRIEGTVDVDLGNVTFFPRPGTPREKAAPGAPR